MLEKDVSVGKLFHGGDGSIFRGPGWFMVNAFDEICGLTSSGTSMLAFSAD